MDPHGCQGSTLLTVTFLWPLFFLIAVYLMAYTMNSAELFSSGTRSPNHTYVKKEDKPFVFLSAVTKHLIGNNLMEEGLFCSLFERTVHPILAVTAGP